MTGAAAIVWSCSGVVCRTMLFDGYASSCVSLFFSNTGQARVAIDIQHFVGYGLRIACGRFSLLQIVKLTIRGGGNVVPTLYLCGHGWVDFHCTPELHSPLSRRGD